jgi:spore germination protein GerM
MAEIQKDTVGSRENTLRFLDMVGLFSSQAMMGLGKIANPMTGKAEKNLPAARLFIDTLEMLEQKTAGNLTADEKKVLQAALTDLRIMFVEESAAPAAEPKSETPPATDDSKVKFQKKYD